MTCGCGKNLLALLSHSTTELNFTHGSKKKKENANDAWLVCVKVSCKHIKYILIYAPETKPAAQKAGTHS